MKILYVEDQNEYEQELINRLGRGIKVSPYSGRGQDGKDLDNKPHTNGNRPIEYQIEKQITGIEKENGKFDVVLLDTDLSAFQNGISQSSMRTACSHLGIPVLRYSKKPAQTQYERMRYLAEIAREGSQSILVPHDVLMGNGLSAWIKNISKGFTVISNAIGKYTATSFPTPAKLIAQLVKIPEIEIDLTGYLGANFFFFGDLIEKAGKKEEETLKRNYSTQLGYWFYNYVLLFPGPILNIGATAAYLELAKKDLDNKHIKRILEVARYKGPFSDLGTYYIKRKLDDILVRLQVDSFSAHLKSQKIRLGKRPYAAEEKPSYYCVVNDEPIAASDAKGPLEWMPRGAQICRIKKSTFNKLGPWIND